MSDVEIEEFKKIEQKKKSIIDKSKGIGIKKTKAKGDYKSTPQKGKLATINEYLNLLH